jgi:putative ABC transport system ATP-binding protein
MPAPAPPLIRARTLGKTYQDGRFRHPVLRGVDLEVAAGERVALLGRSGSGKSTLLNLLAGIDRPDAGTLEVAGLALPALPERQRTLFRRRQVGFVYQFFNLIPTLTVRENLRLPLELNRWPEARSTARVAELLAALGLEDRAGAFPDHLSGGEQQRVAVARALVHDPPLVLADEPTGNLDAGNGRQVLDLLGRLTRDAGHTLVLVTHSREVAAGADRILVLQDGRLGGDAGELTW